MVSDHFMRKDFACRCGECKPLIKISLGLVGGLELLCETLSANLEIIKGYECADSAGKSKSFMKNYHTSGIAAEFICHDRNLKDVFKAAIDIPEFKGVGLDLTKSCIHVDTRKDK